MQQLFNQYVKKDGHLNTINSLLQEELSLLSNHGETIEFPKHIAARLISVLATQLTTTHWRIYMRKKRKKKKVIFL